MSVSRGFVIGIISAALLFALAAGRPAFMNPALMNPALMNPALMNPALMNPALMNEVRGATASRPQTAQSEVAAEQPANALVWGKVPFCNCFATTATDNGSTTATTNVANALKAANLDVTLQEQSPRDGWLFFAVTYDTQTVTADQVRAAVIAGGGQVLDGPP